MNTYMYTTDNKGGLNVPGRRTFESWNTKQRHGFLKRYARDIIKKAPPHLWYYLFMDNRGYCIRFQKGRRKQITRHEVLSIEEGERLAAQSKIAVDALNHFGQN